MKSLAGLEKKRMRKTDKLMPCFKLPAEYETRSAQQPFEKGKILYKKKFTFI